MYDEMNINNGFIQKIISKMIERKIRKNVSSADVRFYSPINIRVEDDDVVIRTTIEVALSKDDIMRLLKDVI